ncbi:MAG: hypothetical protein ACRCTZ_16520 [Sarcina sp.]
MKIYIVSSVNLDCGEYMSKTIWSASKTREEANEYIKVNNIEDYEFDVEIDTFDI